MLNCFSMTVILYKQLKATIMKKILHRKWLSSIVTLIAVFSSINGFSQPSSVVVAPTCLNGWAPSSSGGSTLTFVNGPASPPLGSGSAQFTVDNTGATAAQLRN